MCAWHHCRVFKSTTWCRKDEEHWTKYCVEKKEVAGMLLGLDHVLMFVRQTVILCLLMNDTHQYTRVLVALWASLKCCGSYLVFTSTCLFCRLNTTRGKPQTGGAKWLICKNITGDFTQDLKHYLPLQECRVVFVKACTDWVKLYWSCSFAGKAINFALHLKIYKYHPLRMSYVTWRQ